MNLIRNKGSVPTMHTHLPDIYRVILHGDACSDDHSRRNNSKTSWNCIIDIIFSAIKRISSESMMAALFLSLLFMSITDLFLYGIVSALAFLTWRSLRFVFFRNSPWTNTHHCCVSMLAISYAILGSSLAIPPSPLLNTPGESSATTSLYFCTAYVTQLWSMMATLPGNSFAIPTYPSPNNLGASSANQNQRIFSTLIPPFDHEIIRSFFPIMALIFSTLLARMAYTKVKQRCGDITQSSVVHACSTPRQSSTKQPTIRCMLGRHVCRQSPPSEHSSRPCATRIAQARCMFISARKLLPPAHETIVHARRLLLLITLPLLLFHGVDAYSTTMTTTSCISAAGIQPCNGTASGLEHTMAVAACISTLCQPASSSTDHTLVPNQASCNTEVQGRGVATAGAESSFSIRIKDTVVDVRGLPWDRNAAGTTDEEPEWRFVAELLPDIPAGHTQASLGHISTITNGGNGMLQYRLKPVVAGPYHTAFGLAHPGGLLGTYYDNEQLQLGAVTRTRLDPLLDLAWPDGIDRDILVGVAGVRWCGYLKGLEDTVGVPQLGGQVYTISLVVGSREDGARLYVNGTRIIDFWDPGIPGMHEATVVIAPRTLSAIQIEYRHTLSAGPAGLRLMWSSPSMPTETIPSSYLFSATTVADPLALIILAATPAQGALSSRNQILPPNDWTGASTAGVTSQFTIHLRDEYDNNARIDSGKMLLASVEYQDESSAVIRTADTTFHGVAHAKEVNYLYQFRVVPKKAGASTLTACLAVPDSLTATYYSHASLQPDTATSSRAWPGRLEFSPGTGGLDNVPSMISVAGFGVRWAGFIQPPGPGEYALYANLGQGSERVKLWVDNKLVIDQWTSLVSTSASGTLQFADAYDSLYHIRVEYKQHSTTPSSLSAAQMSLQWESPPNTGTNTPKALVASDKLYSASMLASLPMLISPAKAAASTSVLMSMSLGTAGTPSSFTIIVRDVYGNPASMRVGNHSVAIFPKPAVTLRVGDAVLEPYMREIQETNTSSTYTGEITPISVGAGTLNAVVDDAHVSGSPFNVHVQPGLVAVTKCRAYGNALSLATAGVLATFAVSERDEHGNAVDASRMESFMARLLPSRVDMDQRCVVVVVLSLYCGGVFVDFVCVA
jgi:hypothetical protein